MKMGDPFGGKTPPKKEYAVETDDSPVLGLREICWFIDKTQRKLFFFPLAERVVWITTDLLCL